MLSQFVKHIVMDELFFLIFGNSHDVKLIMSIKLLHSLRHEKLRFTIQHSVFFWCKCVCFCCRLQVASSILLVYVYKFQSANCAWQLSWSMSNIRIYIQCIWGIRELLHFRKRKLDLIFTFVHYSSADKVVELIMA